MSITQPKCVFVALGIQHAMRLHHIVLSSVACLAVQGFAHYLINGTILEKKKLLNPKYVNDQLDATIIILLLISISSTCFER